LARCQEKYEVARSPSLFELRRLKPLRRLFFSPMLTGST